MSVPPPASPGAATAARAESSTGDGLRNGAPAELAWSAPPTRAPRRAAILAVALLAGAIGTLAFHQPLFGLLGFAMILGSTADHWMGTAFRLDAKGASARTGPSLTAMEWKEVRRVLLKGNDIRLSPLESPSALDAFRGVGLIVTPENRDEVMRFVDSHAVASRILPDGDRSP